MAKMMADAMGAFGSDYTPEPKDIADWNRSKVPDEVIMIFGDSAQRAYQAAWDNAVEGYFVEQVMKRTLDLLNESGGSARYKGMNSEGEEVSVDAEFDVSAKATGDISGIYSNPIIEITITNPVHLVNEADDMAGYPPSASVDRPYGDASDAVSALLNHISKENPREVKNLGDIDTSNADMDWDYFNELFEEDAAQMDPDEIASAIKSYASDSDESVEDVVDMIMKSVPSLKKKAGDIANALEGVYDPRQMKLPLSSAVKALATAQKAIAAVRKPPRLLRDGHSQGVRCG